MAVGLVAVTMAMTARRAGLAAVAIGRLVKAVRPYLALQWASTVLCSMATQADKATTTPLPAVAVVAPQVQALMQL